MPITLVNPMNETPQAPVSAAPRMAGIKDKTVALLDISKPGGNLFLDRLEQLLKERHGVARVVREKKPTFARPAPPDVMERLRAADAVIEALAD